MLAEVYLTFLIILPLGLTCLRLGWAVAVNFEYKEEFMKVGQSVVVFLEAKPTCPWVGSTETKSGPSSEVVC